MDVRHGSADVPPEELCPNRTNLRQGVLLEGAARMLRARRRALRLEPKALGAAANARRVRAAGWLGHGYRDLSGTHVRSPGARGHPARSQWDVRWRDGDRCS